MTDSHLWWQTGVIYEIYPRSFADSDGDGAGDLPGVRGRLDYLRWLGVDAIWLTPFYPSPMVDGGYDVADYTDVHPMFGDLQQFDLLVAEAHRRSLRVIVDLVPNHTSDQHPWFIESRSSRDNPRRDWYIWRDPAPDGGPPNNWISEFGGSGWTLDESTGQYYYHAFAEAQPDLNWRNPDVRRAMYDVMRFWLDRGVDGFRVDVMWHVIKDELLRDNPPNPDYREGVDSPSRRLIQAYSTDQPEVHDVVAEMRGVLDEYDERVMIAEIYLPVDRLVDYYGRGERAGAHLPFNFHLILTPWDAREIELVVDRYEGALPANAWPNWVLGNHDLPRVASRIGPKQARIAAMLLLSLRGTPTLYYGEELGTEETPVPPEDVQDVREINQPGRGLGRDPCRTPMPWDGSPGAGFTTGRPWLPIGEDNRQRNVEALRSDPDSMLSLYRRLLELRRREPALTIGSYRPVPASGSVLAFEREQDGRRLLVALNLSDQPAGLELEPDGRRYRPLLSTLPDAAGGEVGPAIELRADEGLILEPLE
ncbi:MAG TPA: alpha-amylase family glycosyl hydrolase [Candidatus Limnocylindria bacterium]|nr:alpha-amylase family glycosyl hydrolase [Candidatus Limnocylindria bacterium]